MNRRDAERNEKIKSTPAYRSCINYIGCLTVVWGLSGLLHAAAQPEPLPESTHPVIEMKRIPGWKTRSYQIQIFGDGTVLYTGIRRVAVIGEQKSTLSASELKRLYQVFSDADFFALSDSYIIKGLQDCPILELAFNAIEKFKTVRLHTCLSGPIAKKVMALGNEIDNTVGSSKWIRQ